MRPVRVIAVLATCGVLITGIASEVGAVRAGAYRCTGALDNVSVFMDFTHYNPTANIQTIRRVRVFDSAGALYFDTGAIVVHVPALGSLRLAVDETPPAGFDDVQVIVNWTQVVDTAAPIAKADFFQVNTSGDISIARTSCP